MALSFCKTIQIANWKAMIKSYSRKPLLAMFLYFVFCNFFPFILNLLSPCISAQPSYDPKGRCSRVRWLLPPLTTEAIMGPLWITLCLKIIILEKIRVNYMNRLSCRCKEHIQPLLSKINFKHLLFSLNLHASCLKDNFVASLIYSKTEITIIHFYFIFFN